MRMTNIYQNYPQGWFAVCFSEEIASGQAIAKKLMGKELVLWRDKDGNAHLQDAYCPHLGTHLGHCGQVIDNKIKCPFHGLTFDGNGQCSTKIKKVNETSHSKLTHLKTYPIQEQNGIIFSAFDSEPAFAHWMMDPVDTHGYTEPKRAQFKIESTPHEITENTVDLRHFSALHQYRGAHLEYESNGQYLQVRTYIKRDGKLFGKKGLVEIETLTHHHGLGYANVHILVTDLGLKFCGFVLPTPIDHKTIELRFKLQMKKIEDANKVHPLLRFIPKGWATQLVFWQSFRGFLSNVGEDLPIWKTKAYIANPALSEQDGPIPFYRDWADQFYQSTMTKTSNQINEQANDYMT